MKCSLSSYIHAPTFFFRCLVFVWSGSLSFLVLPAIFYTGLHTQLPPISDYCAILILLLSGGGGAVCRYWQQGHCNRGNDCSFQHGGKHGGKRNQGSDNSRKNQQTGATGLFSLLRGNAPRSNQCTNCGKSGHVADQCWANQGKHKRKHDNEASGVGFGLLAGVLGVDDSSSSKYTRLCWNRCTALYIYIYISMLWGLVYVHVGEVEQTGKAQS